MGSKFAKVNQFSQRPDGHLFHDMASMDLDGLDGNTQVVRNLLVEASINDVLENLAFSPGKGSKAALKPLDL